MYEYAIFQHGLMVASASGEDQVRVMDEIGRYASQYLQEGPIEIRNLSPQLAQEHQNIQPS